MKPQICFVERCQQHTHDTDWVQPLLPHRAPVTAHLNLRVLGEVA